MADKKRLVNAKAPYTFSPFPFKIIQRYKSIDALPHHDKWKTHDENGKLLLTGEITYTITAETPVFISNGSKEHLDFYRTPNGSYAIPGSSLRGLIRTNMQILGMGAIHAGVDFDDVTYFYRDFSSATGSLGESVKKRYHTMLGIKTVEERTVAANVKGGYLHCDNGVYTIVPVKGKVLTVKRDASIARDWKDRWAFTQEIWYQASEEDVTVLTENEPKTGNWKHGMLLGTGWMRNQNHLYIFPDEDTLGADGIVQLTTSQINIYKDDWKMRESSLPGTRADKQDPQFWALPQEGCCKPVFYISNGISTNFGMSQYLRVAYEHPLSYYLAEGHKNAEELTLDYANSIMGFSKDKCSFRSRISVDDAVAEEGAQTENPVDMILGEPKPSFYAGYMKGGKSYNDDFENDADRRNGYLAGFKQYWLKPEEKKPKADKKNVSSVIKPLPKGTTFTGTIRYKNLYEDELGLLLWCLTLDEGCFHNIGQGKPYGYGRISVCIDALEEYDPTTMYQQLCLADTAKTGQQLRHRVQELVVNYDKTACDLGDIKAQGSGKKRSRSVRNMGFIQDFLYLKRTIRTDTENVSYMEPSDHKNLGKPLPVVHDMILQERQEKREQDVKNQSRKGGKNSKTAKQSAGASGMAALQALLDRME